MSFILRIITALAVSAPILPAAAAETVVVPLNPERWVVSQVNFKYEQEQDFSRNGEPVEHLGRPSIRVSKGLFYARGLDLRDGIIEVDMAAATAAFAGVSFRVQNEDNYEVIFFRPSKSGTDQAVQYTPGLLGAPNWQIYTGPGHTAVAQIPRERWVHVKIVLAGPIATLYLDHAAEPTLVVRDLKLRARGGSIGFWGHHGDAFFSNLTYTPAPETPAAEAKPQFLPGALLDWQLSPVFDVTEWPVSAPAQGTGLKWERVAAEEPGMVVINRYRRSPNMLPPDRSERLAGDLSRGRLVFARTTIRAERAQVRRMRLAYSDDVVVFLNGVPLYAGINTYSFRQPGYLGLLDAESEAVYLPLKQGENELLLAVREYFGGWAFLCRLDPAR